MSMTHDVDLRLLRAFTMVADRGSFSAAAEALHITQPALSRRIAELESTLGLRLFNRTSRRVVLTQNGEDLLARSRDLLIAGEALHERAHSLVAGEVGILRVGCAPMTMERAVAPFIAQYRKRCPGVELQLYEQGGERAQEAVLRGQLHAAVASPTEPRLQAQLLFPWRLLAVMPRSHPFARRRTVDIAKLAEEPVLTFPTGFGTRALFDAGCETMSVRPPIRMEATAAQTLLAAAQAGYGIAVVPSALIINKRAVKALPVLAAGKSLGRWLAVVWNERRFCPPYLTEFVELLAGALKRDYPGKEYNFASPIEPPHGVDLNLNPAKGR
jgi:DNA-binding transcriptional LysR family regulator